MTALKPAESWDVTPVGRDQEIQLLRRAVINRVCAHPDCDKPIEGAHHAWPQGFIKSSSYFVRIPGEDKPVFHAVGLCGSGTTGHHGDAEEHRAWIKYEDGVFNWYERLRDNLSPLNQPSDVWHLVGPLDPQPGTTAAPKKARKRKQGAEKRARANVQIAVPKDEQEDGAGVLDDLIEACREAWAPEIGWSESVPAYFVIVAGLAKALQSGT